MAKKKATLESPFAKTEETAVSSTLGNVEIPADGKTRPVGVGLKESEVELIDKIADEYGIARNAIMRYAVRYFLKAYYAGEIDLSGDVEKPPPPRNVLSMP